MSFISLILNIRQTVATHTHQTQHTKPDPSPNAMTGSQLANALEKMFNLGESLQNDGAPLLGRASLVIQLNCEKAEEGGKTNAQTIAKCYTMQCRLNNMLNVQKGDEIYFPSAYDREIMAARFTGN